MKRPLFVTTMALVVMWSTGAFAQSPQEHHPSGAPPQAQTAPQPAPPAAQPPAAAPGQAPGQMPMGQMMQSMPEQCRAMMQNMPPGCMAMMRQMMQGGMEQGSTQGQMGQGGMMHGTPAERGGVSDATKAYMDAANKMHVPMMQGLQAADPDVAFVRGMIAHHEGAINMAKVRLRYGKDEQTRKWADDVVSEQQREIDEMEAWLKKNAR